MLTPAQIAKSDTEHAHQAAFFAYCAFAHTKGFLAADLWAGIAWLPPGGVVDELQPEPRLKWIHAIPNGGSRGDDAKSRAIRGGKLKAEGVRQGVADVFLPVPRPVLPGELHSAFNRLSGPLFTCCGLYIEMKKPSEKAVKATSKGGLSDEQIKFKEDIQAAGYGWVVCYSWEQAVSIVKQYLNNT